MVDRARRNDEVSTERRGKTDFPEAFTIRKKPSIRSGLEPNST
jgi:hypothetical protein